MSPDILGTFLASLDPSQRSALETVTNLPLSLQTMYTQGRDAWPNISLDPGIFVAFVASRLPPDQPALESLAAIRASDLYIACACANNDPRALTLFEKHFICDIDGALRRMRAPAHQIDEVKQLVRQKLFVSEGTTGKIVHYSGRGNLRRWVRSVATRTYLNEIRKHKREVQQDPDRPIFDGVADDPGMEYMKRHYRSQLRSALVKALHQLEDRQQNVLRYHHVDRLNIDEIGAIYRVHRVTAYRWLEKARVSLIDSTRRLLREELEINDSELQDIMRMLCTQLDLQLTQELRQLKGDPPN